jgi:hypothetical protein
MPVEDAALDQPQRPTPRHQYPAQRSTRRYQPSTHLPTYKPHIHRPFPNPLLMATTVKTPSHTDPETKKKEDKNETTIKDKPSGKSVKTQKK